MSLVDQLTSAFNALKQPIHDSAVMNSAVALCTEHSISAQQLARMWESFLVNSQSHNVTPTQTHWTHFKGQVAAQQHVQKKPVAVKQEGATPDVSYLLNRYGRGSGSGGSGSSSSSSRKRKVRSRRQSGASDVGVTPVKLSVKLQKSEADSSPAADSPKAIMYSGRVGSGDIRASFNDEVLLSDIPEAPSHIRKDISVSVTQGTTQAYPFMWDRLEDRAAVFQERSSRLSSAIAASAQLQLEPFHMPHPEPVVAGGLVCGETDDKLNATSVLLQGRSNPAVDMMHRVSVSLRECPQYALFPGQSVALRGVNASGARLAVTQVLTDASLPTTAVPLDRVYSQGSIRVAMASGPYCTHADLDYLPLKDLLTRVLNSADVLILMGPFVDATHPHIANGSVSQTYEDIWRLVLEKHIVEPIEAHNATAARGMQLQSVILVPSLDDIHHPKVFPQFPLSHSLRGTSKTLVQCVPNPCVLDINGVQVGICTADPLHHVSSTMLMHNVEMRRPLVAAAQLIAQQSFFPVYPSPPGINIDSTKFHDACEFHEHSPHVLIVPSKLKEFVEKVADTLVVNPSHLIRAGFGGGTYGVITLCPAQEGTESYDVLGRIGCSVVRV